MNPRVAIPGSELNLPGDDRWLPADPNEQITATLIIRRPNHGEDVGQQILAGTFKQMTREQAEDYMRVDPSDLSSVRAFTQTYGLAVLAENAEARTIKVRGSVSQLGHAFGVKVAIRVDQQGRQYLSYEGALTVPRIWLALSRQYWV